MRLNLRIYLLVGSCLHLLACGRETAALDSARVPSPPGIAGSIRFDAHILVDQFGYRPGDPKVAVIRDPHVGFDSKARFSAGPDYQVRRTVDGNVVFSGAPIPWQHGSVQDSSGDSGWWFDFSAVRVPGSYFVYDAQQKARSAPFTIDQQVYKNALKVAVRMFYYQRAGFAKQRPFADECWVDEPAYIGPNQDGEAHDINDRDNKYKFRNLSGGWFDAGDTNKYVTFAAQPVHQLLTAYQETPSAFTDDFNIPESGNGIPDLIDEVKWETDWLEKMQYPDGSAALKVGEIVYAAAAPPSSDHKTRYYIPKCSSSTIAVAGMFAHASYVYAGIPALVDEAAELKLRAISAWNNYQRTTEKDTHCDSNEVHAGNADWPLDKQKASAVVAAIYLFAITDSSGFDDYMKSHYTDLRPYHDLGWSRYDPEQGEALLFYTTLPHADADMRRTILADKLKDVKAPNQVYGFRAEDDLYRNFMHGEQYHWGSNNPRAGYGNTNFDVLTYDVDPREAESYRTRALDVLHYFHGVNPFALVYLSNMYSYGATKSVNEIFHVWFAHNTRWSDALASECGPAPGFVPGGPNAQAAASGVPSSIAPPAGQPPQKSYKDWNIGSPESAWAINEPAIYYQSGYVKLISKFAR
jgi:hypothetical protein